MIRLIGGLVIQEETYDYMLGMDTGRKDKRNGSPVLNPISYHGSVQKAIRAARREYMRKCLGDDEKTLSEALTRLHDADRRFERMLSECLMDACKDQ